MEVKVTKTNFFIVSTILFIPLIAMMLSWFMIVYVFFTLKYYPIDINERLVMNQYYSHYQESKDNPLKYKVLVLGLDGILEEELNVKNSPDIMHKSLNAEATNYWDSVNRFALPDHFSKANVKAAVRGGSINWDASEYQYDSTSFFTSVLNQNANYKTSSIQLHYPDEILAINNLYIEPETLQKIDAKELAWDAAVGVNDAAGIYNLYLEMINAINMNQQLVFGFDTLSDEVAHFGWTVHSKKYQYSLWIQNQYVKGLQDLLAKRTAEFGEKWMFLLFTDHGRDKGLDGQHHQLDSKSLKAWFYTNQPQSQIEQWINKPTDSNQRGLIDIKNVVTGYLGQN
ncbi:hypothetical protein [Spiroplasma platyhelix]|uniref:Uncharacterized protein n=1 Tax=Spiroplasma platyhelix PALS-1 TaxID=1276218 RepID=A0A846U043_9MOLU|nr:hypothetical protein [Spiroplasma platyhelix]MBE4703843.1 hypothetical protein [Spiroplasma platyhelix PALS-1]NKE38216.1 hypothetical protein [Spiroplasma platyhelix PALS-1]UJB29101.1 hypothetical protein SPLAT_v1c03370 [Spiroplasma platyhelix PALS-1]